MASVLGYTGLKSKLKDWRESRGRHASDGAASADRTPRAGDSNQAAGTSVDLPRVLETLVIPKLVAGCSPARRSPPLQAKHIDRTQQERPIPESAVEAFASLCMTGDAPTLLDYAERFLSAGHSVETIYIGLLAPAARRLGEFWEADKEDFVNVTMGLWRIQEVLRELTLKVPPMMRAGGSLRTSLFSTMPGDQHSFGTLMVAECFERSGWQTEVLIEPTQSELIGKSARQRYDLIGLTVSCDCSSATLAGLVTAIKAVSSNPCVKVLVGGPAINLMPELAMECGADGTAVDARAAIGLADRLVPLEADRLAGLL